MGFDKHENARKARSLGLRLFLSPVVASLMGQVFLLWPRETLSLAKIYESSALSSGNTLGVSGAVSMLASGRSVWGVGSGTAKEGMTAVAGVASVAAVDGFKSGIESSSALRT